MCRNGSASSSAETQLPAQSSVAFLRRELGRYCKVEEDWDGGGGGGATGVELEENV
jgi:hypothetical protein